MRVSRSSFIEEPTAARTLSGMIELGLPKARFPSTGGYNACYLRPGASCAALAVPSTPSTENVPPSPLLAFWRRGLGRTAALAVEADGPTSGAFATWPDRTRLAATLCRWLAGEEQTALGRARVSTGPGEATVRFEIEPGKELALAAAAPSLLVVSPDTDRPTKRVPLRWEGERTLVGRYPLDAPGVHFATIDFGDLGALRAPPVALSYPPEFLPRTRQASLGRGEDVLESIAQTTGGAACVDLASVFDEVPGARARPRDYHIGWLIASIAAALLIAEIAGRRLVLWSRASGAIVAAGGRAATVVRTLRRARRKAPPAAAPAPAAAAAKTGEPTAEVAPAAPPSEPAAERQPDQPQHSVADAMTQVMARTRKKKR
jgi:hypothetical protein